MKEPARISAGFAILVPDVGPIRHKSAGLGIFTRRVHRRYGGLGAERCDASGAAGEKRIGIDQNCAGFLANDGVERGIDLGCSAGLEHLDASFGSEARVVNLFFRANLRRICRVHQNRNGRHVRRQHVQKAKAFGAKRLGEKADPGQVAFRAREAGDQAGGDGIDSGYHHNRNCRCRRLGHRRGGNTARRDQHRNTARDQFGRHAAKTLVVALCPAKLDGKVPVLDETCLGQTLAESRQPGRVTFRRSAVQEADHRHRSWLLRQHAQRPNRCTAAKQLDDVAPLHCHPLESVAPSRFGAPASALTPAGSSPP